MNDKNDAASGGGGLLFVVFVVFLVLKMTGTVDWSWWWVTCPLWIGFALPLAILATLAAIGLAAAVLVVPIFAGVWLLTTAIDEFESWRVRRRVGRYLRRSGPE